MATMRPITRMRVWFAAMKSSLFSAWNDTSAAIVRFLRTARKAAVVKMRVRKCSRSRRFVRRPSSSKGRFGYASIRTDA